MKTKVIYLILFLIFVLILIIFLKSRSQESGQLAPPPIKQYIPTPNTQTNSFKLISTNIPKELMSITGSIQLTFNQPVSENLVFTIEPKAMVQSRLETGAYEFVIAPTDAWAFDTTYTLTISKSNLSRNNQNLDQDYVYTFKTPPFSGI